MDCSKQYGDVSKSREAKVLEKIQSFCKLLRGNKVKDSKAAFLELPLVVQCLFLHYGWDILAKGQTGGDSYKIAFYLFKLFRGKDMKENDVYKKSTKVKNIEAMYKKALAWNRTVSPTKSSSTKSSSTKSSSTKSSSTKSSSTSSGSSKSPSGKASVKGGKKKYDKLYQKHPEPEEKNNPLYIFYTSLYSENPKSRLAITWLAEYGIFKGEKRAKLEGEYKKLLDSGKLVK